MSKQIMVPDIGADEVEVTEIMVAVGDKVELDQSLIAVEGDKASMEVPAPAAATPVVVLGGTEIARVVAPDLLVFPDYDGNGMFKSLGNIAANPHVGLLFIAMGKKAGRLRVN